MGRFLLPVSEFRQLIHGQTRCSNGPAHRTRFWQSRKTIIPILVPAGRVWACVLRWMRAADEGLVVGGGTW